MESVAKIVTKPVMVGGTAAAIVAITPGHRMINVRGYNVPNWLAIGLIAGASSAVSSTAEVAIEGLLPDGVREFTMMGSRAVTPIATGGVVALGSAVLDGTASPQALLPLFVIGAASEVLGTYTYQNFVQPGVGML